MAKDSPISWESLLVDAVSKPGRILEAYSAFHNYSMGNQLLALFQCAARGIEPGPISTFVGWKDKGRYVRKGEHALILCMPITCKRGEESEESAEVFTRFIFRANWFVLSQTDGQEFKPEPIADFDLELALRTLEIARVDFEMLSGNVQGYALSGRRLAINPCAQLPYKTTFHELGHILLGHCEQGEQSDGETLPRSLKEAEAEAVALLCCESLGLPGADYARGYIQNWLAGATIPEASARRIFKAADQILKAGVASAAPADREML